MAAASRRNRRPGSGPRDRPRIGSTIWFDLDVTDWASITDVYGPAGDVPRLLQEAEAAGNEPKAWNDLWGRLCHQGTVSPASYAALPLLFDIAERHGGATHIAALDLAAGILASTDGPRDLADVRSEHAVTIARLRDLAERNLAWAQSDADFVYAVQALMAFEGRGAWQRELSALVDGELGFECPRCGEDLLLDLEGGTYSATSFSDGSCLPTTAIAADPGPGSDERRVLDLAIESGREGVVDRLRRVFGDVVCPRCGERFGIPSAM